VVQIYRTEVSISKANKVVFILVDLADFNNNDFIRRFQGVLWRAALTLSLREGLQNLDVIQIDPEAETHFTLIDGRIRWTKSSSHRDSSLHSTCPKSCRFETICSEVLAHICLHRTRPDCCLQAAWLNNQAMTKKVLSMWSKRWIDIDVAANMRSLTAVKQSLLTRLLLEVA
jgi:hypothetical protein